MDHREAGKLGGLATKHFHGLEICPTCGQVVSTDHFKKVGAKGGRMTVAKYGNEHMRELGKKGGRPKNKPQKSTVG